MQLLLPPLQLAPSFEAVFNVEVTDEKLSVSDREAQRGGTGNSGAGSAGQNVYFGRAGWFTFRQGFRTPAVGELLAKKR